MTEKLSVVNSPPKFSVHRFSPFSKTGCIGAPETPEVCGAPVYRNTLTRTQGLDVLSPKSPVRRRTLQMVLEQVGFPRLEVTGNYQCIPGWHPPTKKNKYPHQIDTSRMANSPHCQSKIPGLRPHSNSPRTRFHRKQATWTQQPPTRLK